MSSRRDNLTGISWQQAQHAGLWLDKFISSQSRDDVGAKQTVIAEAVGMPVAPAYRQFYERWKRALDDQGAQIRYAEVMGRMVVGLGAESVLETAVTLHRVYGVPYIPGGALKGLAAAYARQRLDATWQKPATPTDPAKNDNLAPYEVLFGTTKIAGYVTFFDALYVPGTGKGGRPLHSDVLTVHHRDYYGGKSAAPADWDSPVPVPFISATGCYLLALAGEDAWVNTAFEILKDALRELGIGAKTSSGYGRMLFVAQPTVDRSVTAMSQRSQSAPDAQPSAEPPRQAEEPPRAPHQEPHMPSVGEVFRGEVLEIDESAVLVRVPGFAPEQVIGMIKSDHLGGKRYRVGNTARVEVVSTRILRSGRTIMELKPATMQS